MRTLHCFCGDKCASTYYYNIRGLGLSELLYNEDVDLVVFFFLTFHLIRNQTSKEEREEERRFGQTEGGGREEVEERKKERKKEMSSMMMGKNMGSHPPNPTLFVRVTGNKSRGPPPRKEDLKLIFGKYKLIDILVMYERDEKGEPNTWGLGFRAYFPTLMQAKKVMKEFDQTLSRFGGKWRVVYNQGTRLLWVGGIAWADMQNSNRSERSQNELGLLIKDVLWNYFPEAKEVYPEPQRGGGFVWFPTAEIAGQAVRDYQEHTVNPNKFPIDWVFDISFEEVFISFHHQSASTLIVHHPRPSFRDLLLVKHLDLILLCFYFFI